MVLDDQWGEGLVEVDCYDDVEGQDGEQGQGQLPFHVEQDYEVCYDCH